MPMKRQREEIMEQGQTSQAEPMPSLARDDEEEFPLQEPNPQEQDPEVDTREVEEPLNIPSPLSVEEVVEMEQVQEHDKRSQTEEGAPSQEAQVQRLEQELNAGTPPREDKGKEVVEEAGSLALEEVQEEPPKGSTNKSTILDAALKI